jgi:hypothetical protein
LVGLEFELRASFLLPKQRLYYLNHISSPPSLFVLTWGC